MLDVILQDEKTELKAKLVLALEVESPNVWLVISVEVEHLARTTGEIVISIRVMIMTSEK